ncbi:hypothetical protein ACVWXM_008099 [Bradyrhizobium sp. GM7.3]
MSFISKWVGLLGLLAVLVIGDQIRINRPGHKYRLAVEVTTPDGIKTGSGILSVVPDRGYSRGGRTTMRGEAVFVDLGRGKNVVALLAHQQGAKLDLDDINYVALRAYGAARGNRVSFNELNRQTGVVAVQGDLMPALVSFGDPPGPYDRAPCRRRPCGGGAGRRLRTPWPYRRNSAQRALADRFRWRARGARDARNRDETALVGCAGRPGGDRAEDRRPAPWRRDRGPGGICAKIALPSRVPFC